MLVCSYGPLVSALVVSLGISRSMNLISSETRVLRKMGHHHYQRFAEVVRSKDALSLHPHPLPSPPLPQLLPTTVAGENVRGKSHGSIIPLALSGILHL